MLHQLRPEALGTAGLIEALREQCEALGYRTGAEVALELGEPVPDDRMPPGAQETLFRIAQEMLANVARHARARQVRLWLGRQGEEVVLRVVDDGQGFDPAAETSGMGLRNLKERADSLRGKLEVASTPGSGARTDRPHPAGPFLVPAAVEAAGWCSRNCAYMIVRGGCLCFSLWTGSAAERHRSLEQRALALALPSASYRCRYVLGSASWASLLLLRRPTPVSTTVSQGGAPGLPVHGLVVGPRLTPDAHEVPTDRLGSSFAAAASTPPAPWSGCTAPARSAASGGREPGSGSRQSCRSPSIVALRVGWPLERPGPLTLYPADAFFLAIALVFPYVVSRQPRAEGAPYEPRTKRPASSS